MPIYQRPIENVGVTRTFSGTITDSSNNVIEGAVVVIKRPGSNEILQYVDSDSSGNYTFTIDGDGDFIVGYTLSKDPQDGLTESALSPALAYSSLTNSVVRIGIKGSGSPETYYLGTPVITVTDSTGYGFSGVGVLGSIGHKYFRYGNMNTITSEVHLGGTGKPLVGIKITSTGRSYTASTESVRYITGQKVFGAVFTEPTDKSNRWEYPASSGNWYYAEQTKEGWQPNSYYGVIWSRNITADGSGWTGAGNPYNDVAEATTAPDPTTIADWCYISQALPGQQGRSDFDTTTVDNSVFLNGITNPAVVKKHGMQIYYTLIYGPGGSQSNFTSPSFSESARLGVISQQDLDIMKGYLGRHFYVAELSGAIGTGQEQLANIGNFFYQMTQAAATTVNNAGNGNIQWTATHPDAISDNAFVGYLQYYSMTFVDLMTNIANEYQSFHRQSKGVAVPTSQYSTKIYPIFQKAGISSFTTTDGSTERNYTVTAQNITY